MFKSKQRIYISLKEYTECTIQFYDRFDMEHKRSNDTHRNMYYWFTKTVSSKMKGIDVGGQSQVLRCSVLGKFLLAYFLPVEY